MRPARGRSIALECAPLEGLLCAQWREVRFAPIIDECKAGPDFGHERRHIVPPYGKATALLGPVDGKGGDDHMAAGMSSRLEGAFVSGPATRLGEKMENSAVVPDVVSATRPPLADVGAALSRSH